MPYDIAKGFDGCAYAVVKITPDGRELVPGGCHPTAIAAGKHLAALEAATASEVRHPGHGDQSVHNPHKGGEQAAFPAPNNAFIDKSTIVAAQFPHVGLSDKAKEVASRISGTRKVSESNDAGAIKTVHEATYTSKNGEKFEMKLQQSVRTDGSVDGRVDISGDLDAKGFLTYSSVGRFIETDKPTFARIGFAGTNTVRMGMAGAMLEFARTQSPLPIFHSNALSGEGAAFAASHRTSDTNYELRHPGHGDQSVHNPHKGAGFVRPVAIQRTIETEMAEKFTDEEWKATAYAHRLTPEIKDDKALPSEVPTPEEVKAIQSYQYGSGKFQQSLLNPETEPDSLGEVKALRGVLERNSLQEDTTLYRGIGGAVGNSQMAAKLREAGVGGVVQSDRFVSSAANSRVASAFGEADLVIKAPAGTKGAYLDRIIYAEPSYASVRKYDVQAARKIAIPGRGEAEFVMPPGVKFRVDSITQNQSNGRAVFEVSVIP